jgi:prefoldin subunit 5
MEYEEEVEFLENKIRDLKAELYDYQNELANLVLKYRV